jgi:hypothetical protein
MRDLFSLPTWTKAHLSTNDNKAAAALDTHAAIVVKSFDTHSDAQPGVPNESGDRRMHDRRGRRATPRRPVLAFVAGPFVRLVSSLYGRTHVLAYL